MLAKTGLLVVSNPTQIGKILTNVQKQVKNTLYIQLLSAISEPFGHFYPNVFNSWPKFSQTISRIYSQVARDCSHLDVRVLLSGLKYSNVESIKTQSTIDVVIFDREYSQKDIDSFLKGSISNINRECGVVTIDVGPLEEPKYSSCLDAKVYKHTVLGGTFDRLHIAHKLLLTEAALRSSEKITVGVTEENMLASKTLWELIEPIEKRVLAVEDFLKDICSELCINVVPIIDAFGPTQYDSSMELLVVSAETLKGGNKVNEIRSNNNLPPVEVLAVELIDEPHPNPNEEAKISSSTARMRLLGILLKPVNSEILSKKPYIIGLTGGIASGKSGVAKRLGELGAEIINCDLVAHQLYQVGKECYNLIRKEFGDSILLPSGEINRKELGAIVFNNPDKLEKLNSLIWPAIMKETSDIIKNTSSEIVVIEAAVLLTAGWQHVCHEVWTTLVPKSEAIARLKCRNNLKEEEAAARINSQPNNKFYIENAHVVLCTLWPVEYTRQQINKAWELLQKRLPFKL